MQPAGKRRNTRDNKIEAADKVVCPYGNNKQATPVCFVNIMEDSDATTMCITDSKKAICLHANWNTNCYFIDLWHTEFGNGTRYSNG